MSKYLSKEEFSDEQRREALSKIWRAINDATKVVQQLIGTNDRMYYDICKIIEKPCDEIQEMMDLLYNGDYNFED